MALRRGANGAGGATVLMFVWGFLPWRCRRLRGGMRNTAAWQVKRLRRHPNKSWNFLPVSRFHLRNWGGMEPDMNDLDRLRTLARACVQAANEVEDTTTAAMLLESAQRFLNRADPQFALNGDDEEFNRGQMYRMFEH